MKTKNIFLILFLIFGANSLFAQGENDHWYFGQLAAVRFQTQIPIMLNNSEMFDAFEAVGTASDANGKLLFYTDGKKVFARNHLQMQNGSGLTSDASTQQLAIVKHPGNPNLYYIFTAGFNNGASNPVTDKYISYTVVDMSQGGLGSDGLPLGAVVSNLKNIYVLDNYGGKFRTEAITVVPTKTGSFWVLIPNGLHLYSYLFDSVNGFNNGSPVISDLDFPASLSADDYNHFGIKASPRLKSNYSFTHFLSITSWNNPQRKNVIYSFDNEIGKITSHYRLNIYTENSYISEFNKNASVLFLGYTKMFAVDLLTSNSSTPIYAQLYDLGSNSIFGSIQRNKYNDIYFSIPNSNYLGKINNPEIYGSGINLGLNNVNLGSRPTYGPNLAKYGLPQLIEFPVIESPSTCLPNILLTTQEANANYTHQAIETIIAKDNYEVNASNLTLKMKAGKSITLLPNTFIKNGSDYLAKIEDCAAQVKRQSNQSIRMKLYLDKDIKNLNNEVNIYPNPASDFLTIESTLKVENVSVYDISGKKINVAFTNNKVDVRNLPAGNYMINIETKEGKTTKKFIKK